MRSRTTILVLGTAQFVMASEPRAGEADAAGAPPVRSESVPVPSATPA